ncbi:hypothetical protein A3A93_02380 [Candidatus Roizmanbacteria bacterium RIFCSPLOWO2_01_FULL_38_12]|uniref:BioF2-like acetyltransferase domain-containing protein n=1 Tax=Candidatus Roizmanbacteria bacterium RIFCSPLOWO2_01_FULL_38_12 TaxID=1802061 RepID=A0A1F7IWF4_9BACT|nr:MAG: hypothetical protein A2861_02120 [Candidatus Roizmanbacteria bacterium RIFCSPHIGHO2_01_FULL_38_15]OGK47663.1 MAG: hypothetical protein A3A93_02380 [Candidatus Roizmanbacteria bacterium RIFCSPLOWO2_01_FULL_38_12]
MINIISDTFDRELYNNAAHHPLQSWEWGQARLETGVNVIRVGEYKDNHLHNVFQMTLHPVPHTKWKIGYLPRSVMPSIKVIEFLFEVGREHNLIFIKLEPYISVIGNQYSVISPELMTDNRQQIVKSKHPLFPDWTQILDLNGTVDELLKKMKSKTRYNIRLATKKGVTVKEQSDDQGFEVFLKLYFDTCERQHYYGHDEKYHRIIWENLKNKIAHILIAYYKDEPLAAYELFNFRNRFYYPYGGSSIKHREMMASNLLMWEAIKLGKNLGAKEFDMWGSLPPNSDTSKNDWGGFTRFKEGYGTKYKQFIGSYDLVVKPALYKIYTLAHQLRSVYLGMK